MSTDAVNYASDLKAIEDKHNQSTSFSWLWALLFGPIYFAVHGFWGRAGIVLLLNFFIIGFFVAPFLAYPAWRARARKEAERSILISSAMLRRN